LKEQKFENMKHTKEGAYNHVNGRASGSSQLAGVSWTSTCSHKGDGAN